MVTIWVILILLFLGLLCQGPLSLNIAVWLKSSNSLRTHCSYYSWINQIWCACVVEPTPLLFPSISNQEHQYSDETNHSALTSATASTASSGAFYHCCNQ